MSIRALVSLPNCFCARMLYDVTFTISGGDGVDIEPADRGPMTVFGLNTALDNLGIISKRPETQAFNSWTFECIFLKYSSKLSPLGIGCRYARVLFEPNSGLPFDRPCKPVFASLLPAIRSMPYTTPIFPSSEFLPGGFFWPEFLFHQPSCQSQNLNRSGRRFRRKDQNNHLCRRAGTCKFLLHRRRKCRG